MWIFLNDAMVSIVQSDDPSKFSVRTRNENDLKRLFPDENVVYVKNSDYVARMFIDKAKVVDLISARLADIDYDNFKNSIDYKDKLRHDAYLDVWSDMLKYQYDVLFGKDIK